MSKTNIINDGLYINIETLLFDSVYKLMKHKRNP